MKFLRDATPFTQVIFTLILILTFGILVSLIGFLGIWLVMGIRPDAIPALLNDLDNPGNVQIMKILQILQSFGMFILPTVVMAIALDDKPFRFLQINRNPGLIMILIVCILILVSGPIIEWSSILNERLTLPSWLSSLEEWMRSTEDQATGITKAFLETKTAVGLIGNLVVVAVLPALGEELLFRGLLQQLIKKLTQNSHLAIWITAALFSALHLQFFGFLPRMLLGALFGYLLEWTGSLWLPIVAHFINNASGIITYFLTGEGLVPDKPDAPLFNNPTFFWALLSGVVIWFMLRYIKTKGSELKKLVG